MKSRCSVFVLVVLLALAGVSSVSAQQRQGPAVRSITRITGDLYRVQNNGHYTVFLVTPDGIILADPINVEAANWLKAELTERFPNAPVRYVLYSHHHQDHASGAAVFDDTAELVGHENPRDRVKQQPRDTRRSLRLNPRTANAERSRWANGPYS